MLLAVAAGLAAAAAASAPTVDARYSSADRDNPSYNDDDGEIADWEIIALSTLAGCLLIALIIGTVIAIVIKRNEIKRHNDPSQKQELPLVQTA